MSPTQCWGQAKPLGPDDRTGSSGHWVSDRLRARARPWEHDQARGLLPFCRVGTVSVPPCRAEWGWARACVQGRAVRAWPTERRVHSDISQRLGHSLLPLPPVQVLGAGKLARAERAWHRHWSLSWGLQHPPSFPEAPALLSGQLSDKSEPEPPELTRDQDLLPRHLHTPFG